MTHPHIHAKSFPNKPAYVMTDTGATLTFKQLDEQSNQFAHLLRARGIQAGDHISLMLENRLDFFVATWGAQRAGIIFTALSTRLKTDEVVYILENSQAKLFLTSKAFADVAATVLPQIQGVANRIMIDGPAPGYDDFATEMAKQPTTPIADERGGGDMLYSSGTTGKPKGVFIAPESEDITFVGALTNICANYFGFNTEAVYLSPAPIYHAAPMRYCMTVVRLGGTVHIMPHFDAEDYMRQVERNKITHSQLVPTMFVRMLKLDPAVRAKYDMSSLKFAIHAAAPCPIPVKQQMMEWWGPIIWEYYAGTEGNGLTLVNADGWLANKGTVGKAVLGVIHICDDEGNELPTGEVGTIYFGDGKVFAYHGDDKKTAETRHPKGWTTLGDVGYVNQDGYLFLTDRKAYMIISGGVNIYPQEVEDLLVTHPKVLDAAVFGIPNEDFGEEVKAVVQLRDPSEAGEATAQELIEFCRSNLSNIKSPKSIDFMDELPRHPTGKLYKRLLRDPYWAGRATSII